MGLSCKLQSIFRIKNDMSSNFMRFTPRKCILLLLLLIFSMIIWQWLSPSITDNFTRTCIQPQQVQDRLHALAEKVHNILQTLALTHFLCYGSLWGQIRVSGVLPWENKVVMCLLNEELITKDEVFMYRKFWNQGLGVAYDSYHGEYLVNEINVDENVKVILIVFESDKRIQMYRRVGWSRRLLPPDCESLPVLECFPPRLIEAPLPKKEFGHVLFPVPREGIELQKYHYKKNWWREILLKNC